MLHVQKHANQRVVLNIMEKKVGAVSTRTTVIMYMYLYMCC